MSDHEPITTDFPDPPYEPDAEELPRRPRRRLVTPVTVTLTAVLIAAIGFIGGVQVQKRSQPSTAAAASTFGGRARQGAGGFGQGAGGNATVGQVANVKGSTIYVTGTDGTTIRVKTNSNSKVTRTAKSKASAIHPGDTVVVQGTTSSNGTVTASQIVARASNATSTTPGDPTP
jgi:hypothetical protein